MGNHKADLFKTFLIIGLFTILPALLILANSSGSSQDIRSKATSNSPTPGQIIFVPFSFSIDKNGDSQLDFLGRPPQIRNGFVPPAQVTTGPQYSAILLDDNGRQLNSQKFSLPQVVAIDAVDKNTGRAKAELRKVSADNQGLTLTYHPNASYLQIINPGGDTVKMISLKNMTSADNLINLHVIPGNNLESNKNLLDQLFPLGISHVFAANGTFNIAIIGDNYNDDGLHFQSDVNDIMSGLVSIEPFKSNQGNLVFYTQLSTVTLCTPSSGSPSISCDDTLTLQQASAVPYDKIYVLYNGPYAGYAYVGGTIAYGSNATDKTTAVKQALFIHELAGHTLGGLMDEYSFGTTGSSYGPNCSDSSSCPSWSSIPGLGCYATCGYTNLFRATDNSSVMNNALLSGFLSFDQFSTQVVQDKLQTFLETSPPTPTLPPVQPTSTTTPIPTPTLTITPTPTPTPVPTLTLAPTPTIIISITLGPSITFSPPRSPERNAPTLTPGPSPSPSPSVTPSSTPIPIPTSTPVPLPTRIPFCTFPNFCTVAKLCGEQSILPNDCDVSTRVCCKVEENNKAVSPLSVNATPTIVQQFDPLPTTPPVSSENNPTAVSTGTPTPTPIFSSSLTPTPTSTLTSSPASPAITVQIPQQSAAQPTVSQQTVPGLITTPFGQQSVSPYIPPPTITSIPSVYIYPSPTPFQVENINFERVTPTLAPNPGFLDILKAPTLFVNSLFKSLFSLFSKK